MVTELSNRTLSTQQNYTDKVFVIIFRNASNLMITKESQDSDTYALVTTIFLKQQ